jgi:hypothetical protein
VLQAASLGLYNNNIPPFHAVSPAVPADTSTVALPAHAMFSFQTASEMRQAQLLCQLNLSVTESCPALPPLLEGAAQATQLD